MTNLNVLYDSQKTVFLGKSGSQVTALDALDLLHDSLNTNNSETSRDVNWVSACSETYSEVEHWFSVPGVNRVWLGVPKRTQKGFLPIRLQDLLDLNIFKRIAVLFFFVTGIKKIFYWSYLFKRVWVDPVPQNHNRQWAKQIKSFSGMSWAIQTVFLDVKCR